MGPPKINMPSAYHRQPKRCGGHVRTRPRLAQPWAPTAGEAVGVADLSVAGTGERPAWGQGKAAAGQPRSWSISGYLSSSFSSSVSALPGSAPSRSVLDGGGRRAGLVACARDGGSRPRSPPGPRHRPLPGPAPHLRAAAPAFTLRASLQPLAAPHPPRCSDSANRARRCRSRARPQERSPA